MNSTTNFNGNLILKSKAAFWAGALAVTIGMGLQVPMYTNAKDMGYKLVGMPIDTPMNIGMILVIIGLFVTLYSLIPKPAIKESGTYNLKISALDDAKLNLFHVGLLVVMAVAITLDVMKPTLLSFVMPGMAKEYGLKSPLNPHGLIPVAWLPFSGITGTVMGSFLWGWMGDKIGRRASILMAGITFIATSSCGCMPSFWMNCVMCFLMGWGVGGMLPIIFTLIAETIPARHRGWLMVLLGGDVAGAYILSSSLATSLTPHYSWRILWLIGFPTGILLILLNRWIPESPRFLLNHGRKKEAEDVMKRFGAIATKEDASGKDPEISVKDQFRQLFRTPFLGITAAISILALGAGFVQFGFQLWIPSNLQRLGFTEAGSYQLLRNAAIIGFPLNFLIAWMYGAWSSKKTIIVLTVITAVAMTGFMFMGNSVIIHPVLLYVLLIIPIWGISSVIAVLSAYVVEIYPTVVRSRGSGLIAGVSKFAGIMVITLAIVAIAPPSIAVTALIGAIPLVLAALSIGFFGVETRKRRLEEITEEQLSTVSIAAEK